MTIKNSELRSFARGAQASSGTPPIWLIAPLLVLVPAGGYYLWASRAAPVARTVQSAARPADRAAAQPMAIAAAEAAPVAAPQPAAPQPAAQSGAALPQVDMRAANAALAKGLNLATKDQSLTFMLSASEYSDSISGAVDARGRPKKAISPNDIFAYCTQQAEGLARSRVPAGKTFDSAAGMIMTSEILLCGLRRGGDRLCDKTQKANLAKQMTFYLDLRDGALAALTSDKPSQMLARAALEAGAHQEIRTELRKLASRGVVTTSDFGMFTPSYIDAAIGEYKSAKSVCKR